MTRFTWLAVVCGLGLFAQGVPSLTDTRFCPTPDGQPQLGVGTAKNTELRRVTLDDPAAACNDGTPGVVYVRPAVAGAAEPDGPAANRWVIHVDGGGSCDSYDTCTARWCGLGKYQANKMSSKWAGEYKQGDGILLRSPLNPLGNRNQAELHYCTSDEHSGTKTASVLRSETEPGKAFSLHYKGATQIDAMFDALERGVPGMPKLTDATEVLYSGDSGGADGVRFSMDRIAARLKAKNPGVRVRANLDAGFIVDFVGLGGFGPGDPRDPYLPALTAEYQRVAVGLWGSHLDESCAAANTGAKAYACFNNPFVQKNHLTTPFFQRMDLVDPTAVGASTSDTTFGTFTEATFAQSVFDQMTALPNLRNTAAEKAAISSTPGAVGTLCGQHVMSVDTDAYFGKRIRATATSPAYSYAELLQNWLTGGSPTVVIAPRPPATPDKVTRDSICSAAAPNAPAAPAVALLSSASYERGAPVAPEMIVAVFGNGLASATATASTLAWPTALGGLQVNVSDSKGVVRAAPLYYVSPTQVMFLIPAGTATGAAAVAVGGTRISVDVAAVSPGIYAANQAGTGVAAGAFLRVTAAGTRSEGLLFDPATAAAAAVPAASGDQLYLILYGTGMRGGKATATVGGVEVPVSGPVAQGQYLGLDQVNLGPLPGRVGTGEKEVVIRVGGELANAVTVRLRTP